MGCGCFPDFTRAYLKQICLRWQGEIACLVISTWKEKLAGENQRDIGIGWFVYEALMEYRREWYR